MATHHQKTISNISDASNEPDWYVVDDGGILYLILRLNRSDWMDDRSKKKWSQGSLRGGSSGLTISLVMTR